MAIPRFGGPWIGDAGPVQSRSVREARNGALTEPTGGRDARYFRGHEHDAGNAPPEARPGAGRADPEDPAGRAMGALRRQHAALAFSGGQEPRDQETGAGLL